MAYRSNKSSLQGNICLHWTNQNCCMFSQLECLLNAGIARHGILLFVCLAVPQFHNSSIVAFKVSNSHSFLWWFWGLWEVVCVCLEILLLLLAVVVFLLQGLVVRCLPDHLWHLWHFVLLCCHHVTFSVLHLYSTNQELILIALSTQGKFVMRPAHDECLITLCNNTQGFLLCMQTAVYCHCHECLTIKCALDAFTRFGKLSGWHEKLSYKVRVFS